MLRLALLFLVFLPGYLIAWEKAEHEEGIEVFSRPKTGSDFLEFKLITRLDAEFSKVVNAMQSEGACLEWSLLCEQGQVLERISESEQINYLILDFPWPFSHRHGAWLIKRTLELEVGIFVMQMNAMPERVLPRDFELLISNGSYKITRRSQQQTEFEWVIHSVPGGSIRATMANKRTPGSLINDVKALKKLLSE